MPTTSHNLPQPPDGTELKPSLKPRRRWLWWVGLLVVLLLGGFFIWRAVSSKVVGRTGGESNKTGSVVDLSGNRCSGSGSAALTHLPMHPDDFSHILPYGLMIDGHVTPVDHWYFSPANPRSARDAYPVYAVGDGTLTTIEHRVQTTGRPDEKRDEYRLVVTISCDFYYYYDLITSLSDEILAAAPDLDERNFAAVNIPLKAGQEIGRIGGQTLDFAVWDTTRPLTGFIRPDHYAGEPWKIYTADPYDYFTGEAKEVLLAKNVRQAEPRAGQIDYDQKGRLIGNWFLEGTGGYASTDVEPGGAYWGGHLGIVYNFLDPTAVMVSVGDLDGEAQQFIVVEPAFHPEVVDAAAGPVNYELYGLTYLTAAGASWDQTTFTAGPKAIASQNFYGTMRAQVRPDDSITVEFFPNLKAAAVSDFTAAARNYER